MDASSSQLHNHPLQGIAGHELHEFDLVVSNAKSMGWLAADQRLSAVRRDASVVVSAFIADTAYERCYQDGHRWLYQFLHELSQGLWKTGSTAQHS